MIDIEMLLRRTFEIAGRCRARGDHPFGCLLVDPDGHVVLEGENTVMSQRDCTGHAETNLVRAASARFSLEELAPLTLVTSTEPCAMCSGAIYWSGIGAVVYGLGEDELLRLTGDNPENPTLSLPCREVFARGQRAVAVIGPFLTDEATTVHDGFWT